MIYCSYKTVMAAEHDETLQALSRLYVYLELLNYFNDSVLWTRA